MFINDELRDAVVAGQSVVALRRIAASHNMITLRHDGFRKVREGLTSLEEVIQICGDSSEIFERKLVATVETTAG
jgi:type II secretory ATPase GspE/PulE/Tfp pilus assembly ATPase PilB-like protein